MARVYWSLVIGVVILAVGMIGGVAGLLLFPLLGLFVLLAIVFWLGERKARHKPPVE